VCAPDPARARPRRCLGGSAPRCVDASAAQVAANLAELLRRELEADRAENQRNRSLALIRSVDAHCEALMFVSARPAPGAWHILHVNERAAAVCGTPRAAPRAHRKRTCRKGPMQESTHAGGCRCARLARSGVCSGSVQAKGRRCLHLRMCQGQAHCPAGRHRSCEVHAQPSLKPVPRGRPRARERS
jgi:hypothetical protein